MTASKNMSVIKRVTWPEFLYRAFCDAQYAKDFVDRGRFRLGLMEHYTTIEDRSRLDSKEGASSSFIETDVPEFEIDKIKMGIVRMQSVLGRLHLRGSYINPLYLLCTSGPDVDLAHLRSRFGKWIVRINDPYRLMADLRCRCPVDSSMELCGKPKLEQVSYIKDEIVDINPYDFEAIRLCWTQKPKDFVYDCKWRYIITARPVVDRRPDQYLYYDFGGPVKYADLLCEHGL